MVEDATVLIVIFIITTNLLDRLLQKVLLIGNSYSHYVLLRRDFVSFELHSEENRTQEKEETRSIHTDDKFGKDRIKVQHLQVSTAALG